MTIPVLLTPIASMVLYPSSPGSSVIVPSGCHTTARSSARPTITPESLIPAA
jgi:hypothetical protein